MSTLNVWVYPGRGTILEAGEFMLSGIRTQLEYRKVVVVAVFFFLLCANKVLCPMNSEIADSELFCASPHSISIPLPMNSVLQQDDVVSPASSLGSEGSLGCTWDRWPSLVEYDDYRNPIVTQLTVDVLGINETNLHSFLLKVVSDLEKAARTNVIVVQVNTNTARGFAVIMDDDRLWRQFRKHRDHKPVIQTGFSRGRFRYACDRWALDWAYVISDSKDTDAVVMCLLVHDSNKTRAIIPLVKTLGRDVFLLPGGYVNGNRAQSQDALLLTAKREVLEELGFDMDALPGKVVTKFLGTRSKGRDGGRVNVIFFGICTDTFDHTRCRPVDGSEVECIEWWDLKQIKQHKEDLEQYISAQRQDVNKCDICDLVAGNLAIEDMCLGEARAYLGSSYSLDE